MKHFEPSGRGQGGTKHRHRHRHRRTHRHRHISLRMMHFEASGWDQAQTHIFPAGKTYMISFPSWSVFPAGKTCQPGKPTSTLACRHAETRWHAGIPARRQQTAYFQHGSNIVPACFQHTLETLQIEPSRARLSAPFDIPIYPRYTRDILAIYLRYTYDIPAMYLPNMQKQ